MRFSLIITAFLVLSLVLMGVFVLSATVGTAHADSINLGEDLGNSTYGDPLSASLVGSSGLLVSGFQPTGVEGVDSNTNVSSFIITKDGEPATLDTSSPKNPAGTYTITVPLTGTNASNYVAVFTYTITPKELSLPTLSFSPNLTYGTPVTTELLSSLSGFISGDTAENQGICWVYKYSYKPLFGAFGEWTEFSPSLSGIKNTGTYRAKYNFVSDGNYVSAGESSTYQEIFVATATLTITPDDDQSKTYGEDDPVFTYTVTGSQYDDNITAGDTFFTGALGRSYGFTVGTFGYEIGTLALKSEYTGNYSIDLEPGKVFSITPRALSVTADDKNISYGAAAPTYTATITGFASGETIANLGGELAFACDYDTAQVATRGVGTYTITPSGLTSSNYNISYTLGTLTVGKLAVTVTINDVTTAVYGQTPVAFSATPSPAIPYAEDVGLYELGANNGSEPVELSASSPAGDYYVLGATTAAAVDNYAITFAGSQDLGGIPAGLYTINKADMTLTVSVEGWTYGDAANAPVTSGKLGDGEATIEYKLTAADDSAYTATVPTAAGAYTVRYSVAETANYNAASKTGTFDIARAGLSLSVSITGWTYGAAANAPTVSGNLGSGAETFEYKLSEANDNTYTSTVPTAAGAYIVRATVAATSNYNSGVATTTFSIGKATLTVTTTAQNLYYGVAASDFAYTFTGFVSGDDESVVSGAPAFSCDYETGDGVDTYPITITKGSLEAANYDFSVEGANVVVSARPITVTISDINATYGAAEDVTYTITSELKIYNNEDPAGIFEVTTAATATSDVGNYAITGATTANDNYTVTFAGSQGESALYVIAPASLTVTTAPHQTGTLTYNGTPQTPVVDMAVTAVNGQTITCLYSKTGEENSFVALDEITYTNVADAGTLYYVISAPNHNDASGSFAVTMNKAAITPSVSIAGWTYGAAANEPVCSGNSGNGTTAIEYKAQGANNDTYTTTVPTGAGAYTVRYSVAETANYLGGSATADFSIAKADLTLTVSVEGWTYGDNANDPEVTGNLGDGEETFEYKLTGANNDTYTTTAPTNAGAYTVRYSVAETANYNAASITNTFAIAKLDLYLTLSVQDWTYGDDANELEVAGYLGGGTVTVEYKLTEANDDTYTTEIPTDAGAYTIRYSVAESANYNSAQETAAFNIDAKPVILAWTAYNSFVYNGSNYTVTAEVTNKVGQDAVSVSAYEGTYTTAVAGDYTAIATALNNANYTLVNGENVNYDWSIAKATLTVTYKNAEPLSYVYGNSAVYGLNPYDYVNITGIVAADLQTIAANPQHIQSIIPITVAVGSNKATATPLLSLSGDNFGYAATYWLYIYTTGVSANYTVTDNLDDNAKLVITPKPLTITADDKTITYGDAAPEYTVTCEGFVGGNYNDSLAKHTNGKDLAISCAYSLSDSNNRGVGTYTITPSTWENGNYSVTFVPGTLTVNPKALTLTYNQDAPLAYEYGDATVYSLNPYAYVSGYLEGFAACDLAALQSNAAVTLMTIIPMGISPRDKNHVIPLNNLNGTNFGYAATYYLCVLEAYVSANYNVTVNFDDNAKLVISPKALTITADNETITYGDAAPDFTVTCEGFVGGNYNDSLAKHTDGKDLVFSCSYNLADAANRGAGTYAITPSTWENGNYTVTFVPGTLTVEKKNLTVTYKHDEALTAVYGDAAVYGLNPYEHVNIVGIAAADLQVISSNPAYIQAILPITVAVGSNKATAQPLLQINGSNFGYAATYWLYIYTAGVSANYTVTNNLSDNAKLVISPKALTVTANDATVGYGEEAPEFTANYEGFVTTVTIGNQTFNYNDGPAKFTGTLTFACSYTAGAAVGGTYDIIPSGVSNGNYDITFLPGNLTVTPKDITVTYIGTHKEVTYGDWFVWDEMGEDMEAHDFYLNVPTVCGDEYTSVVSFKFYKEGDQSKTAVNFFDNDFEYAGTYLMEVEGINDSYNVTVNLGSEAYLVVHKALIYVDPTSGQGKVYGEEDGVITYTATVDDIYFDVDTNEYVTDQVSFAGFVEDWGLTVSDVLVGALGRAAGENVADGPFEINVGTLAIRAVEQGMDQSLEACLTFLAENYEIAVTPDVPYTINKRPITVNYRDADPLTYEYGDARVYELVPSFWIRIEGLAPADFDIYEENSLYAGTIVPVTVAVGADRATATPLYSITAANFGYAATYWLYIIKDGVSSNYLLETDNLSNDDAAKLVITPKALTITVENKEITYGDAAPEFTVAPDGFVTTVTLGNQNFNYNDSLAKHAAGKDLVISCDYDVTNEAKRGATLYTITASNWENGNYTVTFLPGTLIVNKKEVTLTWGADSLVYNKTQQLPTVTVGGTVYGDAVNAVVALAGEGSTVNVGNYVATVTGLNNANYQLPATLSKSFAITPKAVTVTAENKASNYEANLVRLTYSDTGIEAGDEVVTISTTADKNKIGTYPITLTSTNNPNYILTLVPGTYTVKSTAKVTEGDDGAKVVEKTEKISEEKAKAEEGVNITNMIQNVNAAAGDAEEATLTLEIGEGTAIAFNKEAIAELSKASDVKIIYIETEEANIDKNNKSLKKAQFMIEVSLGGATFEGGKATITTAFENKAPGGKKAVVYYVDENGKKTNMKGTFKDGTLTFTTGHFSTYVVEYVLNGGAIAGIVIACVVVAALIVLLILFLLKKRNGGKDEGEKEPVKKLPAEKAPEEAAPVEEAPVEEAPAEEANEEKEISLSESLTEAKDFGVAGIVTKKSIIDHLAAKFGDKVELNGRENRTANGRLLLSDNHFAFSEDGKRVCFTYVYQDDDGDVILLLRTTAEHAHEIHLAHKGTCVRSAFPKNKEKDWYSVVVDKTFTEADVFDALDRAVINITGHIAPEEEEVGEMSLKESLAEAKDFGAAGLVTKKSIIDHLAEAFGDKVELNPRENRTPNGKLLLSDNHFAFAPSGKKVCFTYVYEDDEGDIVMLIRTTAEHAHEIHIDHAGTCMRSAFPKNKERDWYSVIVDETFSEEDVYAVLDRAANNVIEGKIK